jgi:hypothetical protein
MPMAAFHISLEHVKPLSPVISLRSSVMALALCFSALQASRFDLGLWLNSKIEGKTMSELVKINEI